MKQSSCGAAATPHSVVHFQSILFFPTKSPENIAVLLVHGSFWRVAGGGSFLVSWGSRQLPSSGWILPHGCRVPAPAVKGLGLLPLLTEVAQLRWRSISGDPFVSARGTATSHTPLSWLACCMLYHLCGRLPSRGDKKQLSGVLGGVKLVQPMSVLQLLLGL